MPPTRIAPSNPAPRQSLMSTWLTPFAEPKYPNVPPLPIVQSALPRVTPAAFDGTRDSRAITPPTARSRSTVPTEPMPKSLSPESSLKRKRTPLEEFKTGRRTSHAIDGQARRPSHSSLTPEAMRSSGLSLRTHTPSPPSSSRPHTAGGTQENPINLDSSSPKRTASTTGSFVVQSSQSDERDEDDDLEETVVLQPRPPAPQTATTYKPEAVAQQHGLDGTADNDSDSSLEDLDTMLRRSRGTARLPTPPKSASTRNKRGATLKMGTYDEYQAYENMLSNDIKHDDTPSRMKPEMSLKSSLAKLVKLHQKNERARTALGEAEAAFNEPEGPDEDDEGAFDTVLLGSLVGQEDGEGNNLDRLVHAMDRAEVMNRRMEWHFFDDSKEEDIEGGVKVPLMLDCIDGPLGPHWQTLMKDTNARDHAFLTGLMLEMLKLECHNKAAIDETVGWLFDAAIAEPRADIRQAYLTTAQGCLACSDYGCIPKSTITSLFERLGARPASLSSDEVMAATIQRSFARQKRSSDGLLRGLKAVETFAPVFTEDAVSYTVCVLARLAADAEVTQHDAEVQLGLQTAFEALVSRLPETEGVLQTYHVIEDSLVVACKQPIIQDRMLSVLPGRSRATAAFRRSLAVAFLASPRRGSSPTPDSPTELSTYADELQSFIDTIPAFDIHESTDYGTLTALMSILDVAIGPGFPSDPCLLSKPLPLPEAHHKASRFSRIAKDLVADPVTFAQKAHNKTVDGFSDSLMSILAKVNDRGASHMARTEAKGVLERVIQRLDLSVRCWPRKRGGGRGAWLMDQPPREPSKQDRRSTLDAFVKPLKVEEVGGADERGEEVGGADEEAEEVGAADEKAGRCEAMPSKAMSSFGEDEFEARAGLTT